VMLQIVMEVDGTVCDVSEWRQHEQKQENSACIHGNRSKITTTMRL